jgi:hypothetical protein
MKNFKQPNTTPQRTRNRKIKSQVSGKEIIKDQSRNKGNRWGKQYKGWLARLRKTERTKTNKIRKWEDYK